jgi:hypothetical protein
MIAIVGLAARVALILVAKLLKQFANGEKVQPEGLSSGCQTMGLTTLL